MAGWFSRLKQGLSKSSSKISSDIHDVFTKRRLDDTALQDLEDILITGDLGADTAAKLTRAIAKTRFDTDVDAGEIEGALALEVEQVLAPVAQALEIDATLKPHVILVAGVNGSGKTTTIGKLAKQYRDRGLSVMLAAGDTFRAAAVEQLQVWGERTGSPVIAAQTGSDAPALAFDALSHARDEGMDVLLIDTAGRLQNRDDLMAELQKVVRVIKKVDASAPHDCILVLDATVGQNAHAQVDTFKNMIDITGLVMTKLDGSARGGVVVALAERFALPVHAVGVGEGIDDLQPFDARAFARALLGLGD